MKHMWTSGKRHEPFRIEIFIEFKLFSDQALDAHTYTTDLILRGNFEQQILRNSKKF